MTHALITREHNGMAFTFREDGWFNMTKAAKAFGKHLDDFWSNADTKQYVGELNRVARLEAEDIPAKKREYVDAKPGRTGGTWAHPKLAVFFARWLDVRFAVWCDAVIEDLLKGKAELVITKPKESAVMALPQDFASALRALADGWERKQKAKDFDSPGRKRTGTDSTLATSD